MATTRALMEFYQVAIPLEVQPSFVLSVERDELALPPDCRIAWCKSTAVSCS